MWFDPIIGRLNRDERGGYLGNFGPSDLILVIYKDGSYELTNFDLTNHYESNEVLLVKKFDPTMAVTAVYFDGAQKHHFIKRFNIETSSVDKKFLFISDAKNSKLLLASTDKRPRLEIVVPKTPQAEQHSVEYLIEEMVEVRGWRAMGNKLPNDKFKEARWLSPLPDPVEETPASPEEPAEDGEDEEPMEDQAVLSTTGEEAAGDPDQDEPEQEPDKPEEENQKSAAKPKKEPKKGSDPQSQLGLFE